MAVVEVLIDQVRWLRLRAVALSGAFGVDALIVASAIAPEGYSPHTTGE
jgi:hypothetical protein